MMGADMCFAQGGTGGGAGGISGGGISTGGILGGISGGGTANAMGAGGMAGSGIGVGSSGIHQGIVPTNPSNSSSFSSGASPRYSFRPYSEPRARDLSDPLGFGRSLPSSRIGRGRAGRPEDLGPAARANLAPLLTNHDVRKGVAYFSRRGMYEDMIYGTKGRAYRVSSGGRPTLPGGPARRAGALGDRSIDDHGIPRALRRVTPEREPDRGGSRGANRR
jgi:hypothetical protein